MSEKISETGNFTVASSDVDTSEEEEKSEVQTEEEKSTEDTTNKESTDDGKEKPKKKSRAQKRIESLSAERNTANEKIAELEAQLLQQSSEIDIEDYETLEDYQKAINDDIADKQPEKVDTEFSNTLDELQSKFDEHADKYDDFDTKIQNKDLQITKSMVMAFNDIDNPVDTAYFYASNVDEAKKVSQMSKPKQLLEVIKKSQELKKKPIKKTTNAPAPIEPVGTGGEYTKSDNELSFNEFEAKRNKESKKTGFW